MKYYLSTLSLCIALFFIGCSSDDEGSGGPTGPGEPEEITATYRLTLTTNFTADTHPTDFPAGAMFGPMFGVSHNNEAVLFRDGQLSSAGFRNYIDTGDVSELTQEISPQDDSDTDGNNSIANVTTGSSVSAVATSSIDVVVTQSTQFISFVAALSPSPDWFVGVDAFDILGSDGVLIDSSGVIELLPFDAGFDAGVTYLSDPVQESIGVSPIVGAPFTILNDAGLEILNPLATLTINRIN